MTATDELKALASVLADWAAPAPGITVYLFGSRVRGDHTSTSDIDVHFHWGDRDIGDGDIQWWGRNNEQDFAAIKAKLPGPLKILERWDAVWCQRVVAAPVIHQDRNVRCVSLPPKAR